MNVKNLSIILTGMLILGGFVACANAQDVEAVIRQFDNACTPVPAPVPNGGGNQSGGGNWGNPSQYEPKALDSIDPKKADQYWPEELPGWGPYGDYYQIEGDPKWTSSSYLIAGNDVIIAVNNKRVKNVKDFNTAMNCVGKYALLTVADHNGKSKNDVYCICAKVENHRLPINVSDYCYEEIAVGLAELISGKTASKKQKDKIKKNKVKGACVLRCFDNFEGYVYRPTCPFPLGD